jgi:hypothetical protein
VIINGLHSVYTHGNFCLSFYTHKNIDKETRTTIGKWSINLFINLIFISNIKIKIYYFRANFGNRNETNEQNNIFSNYIMNQIL